MLKYVLPVAVLATLVIAGCGGPAKPPVDTTTGTSTAPAALPPANAATVALTVTGMHCDACADSITKELKTVDGVYDLQVSFADKHAEVTYDPDKVTPEAIIAAVGAVDATYSASLAGAEPASPTTDTAAAL
jgi:copper chaperone CopZ